MPANPIPEHVPALSALCPQTAGGNSSVRGCRLLAAAVFCLASASYLLAAHQHGILRAPPTNGGDQDSYERLGFNLAAGLGFGFCPADLPILNGESDPEPAESCEPGCDQAIFMPTAYRPPGFPLLVAAVYRISPLNWVAVRVINCLCCAAAVSLMSFVFARKVSRLAGVLAAVLCCIDPRLREFAGTFLTENLTTLAFTLFAITFARCLSLRTTCSAALCGLSLSLLVLIRSFFVAWYPFLWLTVAAAMLSAGKDGSARLLSRLIPVAAFCAASIVLTGPWWIRNCLVLDAIMPTGTQGGIGIADGFSDSAMENFGSWTSQTADQIAEEIRSDPNLKHIRPIEFEKEHCIRGAAAARLWMRENMSLLPQLSWWKLSRLWECGSVLHAGLFVCMFAGMFKAKHQSLSRVMFLLLLLNSLTVVATYHTYERFLTPFRPLIHGFAAFGLEAGWHMLAPLGMALFRRRQARG